jgi:hypothetical protein
MHDWPPRPVLPKICKVLAMGSQRYSGVQRDTHGSPTCGHFCGHLWAVQYTGLLRLAVITVRVALRPLFGRGEVGMSAAEPKCQVLINLGGTRLD